MMQTLQVASKPPRRRSRSPAPHRQPQDLCWYHAKYGEDARKCKPPCSKSGHTPVKVAANSANGLLPSHLFFITDSNSGYRFLVDTGYHRPAQSVNIPKAAVTY